MQYKSKYTGAEIDSILDKANAGSGIAIVDSVDQLDPSAELGSLASVIEPGSIKESSFRDLYQPDMSILDQTTGTLTQPELLSSVTSIKFLTPTDYSGVETNIVLVPRTLSQTDVRMMQMGAVYSDGVLVGVGVYYMNPITGEEAEYIVGQVVDGVYTIDDVVVTTINDILASDDWCYLGSEIVTGAPMTEEQFVTLDKIAMIVAGIPSEMDVWVKKDKWKKLYGKELSYIYNALNTIPTKTSDLTNDSNFISESTMGLAITGINDTAFKKHRTVFATDSSVGTQLTIELSSAGERKALFFSDRIKSIIFYFGNSFANFFYPKELHTYYLVNIINPGFRAGNIYTVEECNCPLVYGEFTLDKASTVTLTNRNDSTLISKTSCWENKNTLTLESGEHHFYISVTYQNNELSNVPYEKLVFPKDICSMITFKDSFCCNNPQLKEVIFMHSKYQFLKLSFSNNVNVLKYDLSNCKEIPHLAYKNAFSGINSACKIIVPDDLYDEWIVAQNWSEYADHIIKKSDWDTQQVSE